MPRSLILDRIKQELLEHTRQILGKTGAGGGTVITAVRPPKPQPSDEISIALDDDVFARY